MPSTAAPAATVEEFAKIFETDHQAELQRKFPEAHAAGCWKDEVTTLVHGRLYTQVNIGRAGRYMVEKTTGNIYGIKGFGKIHKGHQYGTLATAADWSWGTYYAQPKTA